MNLIIKYLFSMPMMAVLLAIFAISCGVATFIENDFGSETAWAFIYSSWWFEFIQVLLGANLLYNILFFRLYRREKLPALIFHAGFLFILIGAGLTRYIGYEGTLHIREGEEENVVKSSEPFIQVQAYKDGMLYGVEYKKLISKLGGNGFSFSFKVKDEIANVKFKEYIPNAISTVVDDNSGVPIISLAISANNVSDLVLKDGDEAEINGVVFSFNKESEEKEKPFVRFVLQDGQFFLVSNKNVDWFKMRESTNGLYKTGEKYLFDDKHLYTIDETSFAAKYVGVKGKEKIVSSSGQDASHDALILTLTYGGTSQDIVLMGRGKGYKGLLNKVKIDDTIFALRWGSSEFELPFSIYLKDFQLERYAGSNSPSSYASEVVVIDKKADLKMPYRIYMNHVLDYNGYRFFQASYDQDEKGTVLSLNKDPGKIPTYIGYILLSLGFLWNIFSKKSRFRKLADDIHKNVVSSNMPKILPLLLFTSVCIYFPTSLMSQSLKTEPVNIDKNVDGAKKHAELFSTILAQSIDGRIYPIDTIAHEILNKVSRKDSYKGMSANQVLFEILTQPRDWQDEPIIRLSHPELKKLVGVSGSYASYSDFFDAKTDEYKLKQVVEIAERKKEAEKNQFDKDVIKVDERLNIIYSLFSWDILRIVPKINDANHKWYSINGALAAFELDEANNIRIIFGAYFDMVDKARTNGNWTSADKIVETIKAYQKEHGFKVIPSQTRIDAEIFFNKAKIFDRIYPLYLLSGFILLLLILVKMAVFKINIGMVVKTLFAINLFTFIVHTLGLILRWYIAEHAPWSNSYESMIYIAWAIAFSGLLFARTSVMSMALAYIVAGITLFTAHLSWLDPHITNLMPVLKSHWLTIHVSVITASYGFLGLCALLGFFVLILYIVRGFVKNKSEIERNITEAVKINEMAMILGLSLLTVGNFLGGVWANESWGRYWGWDPKETWALISILVYAVIVHFRFIPKLNNQFAFCVASTLGYFSIIMTYFGVNFYLSGMHSYASGDPVPVPMFVWFMIAAVGVTILAAFLSVMRDGSLKRL